MDVLTREHLRNLTGMRDSVCVSLYMPTHRTGREIRGDTIRCKNLITQAEERLEEWGVTGSAAKKILDPLWDRHSDEMFWRHQSDGLAIFSSADHFHHFRLPVSFEERAIVNHRYQITPLLRLLQNDGRFYLLAASLNSVRLFEGTHYSIGELHPEGLPRNLVDALNIDEYMSTLQHHGRKTAGPGAGDAAIFHGQGGSDLDIKKKDEIQQFFHVLDEPLKDFFGTERAPLVFAGVEYLFPLFKRGCSYDSIVEEFIPGNPDNAKPEELHKRAWEIVEPIFGAGSDEALNRYGDASAAGRTTDDLDQVVAATRQGQVDTLFIAAGNHDLWGSVDEETHAVQRLNRDARESEDLVDHAATQTLLHGGTVLTVEADKAPNGKPLAALLRYAS